MANAKPRGRPRDPEAAARIMAAALEQYALRGWSGFSIEGVARAANVGKSSMYRRWQSKEQLLEDSIVASAKHLSADIDTGSLCGDVMAWATEVFENFLDPAGWTALRIRIDSKRGTEALAGITERVSEPIALRAVLICSRAVARGELSEKVVPFDVAECLFGSVLMHVMNLPPADYPHAKVHPTQHVRPLMHIVLTGIGATIPIEVHLGSRDKRTSLRLDLRDGRGRGQSSDASEGG